MFQEGTPPGSKRPIPSFQRSANDAGGYQEGKPVRFVAGYAIALILASLCYASLIIAPLTIANWSHVSREILWTDISLLWIYWFDTCIIALPVTAPLAALSVLLRDRVRVANWLYWVAAGGISGLVAASIIAYPVYVISPIGMEDGSDVPFGLIWLKIAPSGLPSGALAGYVFWRICEMLK